MSGTLLYYYFGDDEAYFKALQGEFKKNAKTPVEFKRLNASTDQQIQSLIIKIFRDKPACVFIDLSKFTQDYLHLARIVSRTTFEHPLVTVGLVDYLSPPEILRESIATGSTLSFIKSAEIFDVAFSVGKLTSASAATEHGFANAGLKEEVEVGILCKVGYVDQEGLHIETDHNLSKGDRVVLRHHWLEKKIIPSQHVFVKNVGASNMFYQFKSNADLDFLFLDDFIPHEGMTDEAIKEKKSEREDILFYHKKQYKRWMDENRTSSHEKRAKVLVVDYKFHFYENQPRTDKHAYTIRCIPFFTDIAAELERLRPQIIAYELQTAEGKNTLEELQNLVKTQANIYKESTPFIIVFNCKMSSAELQSTLQYQQVIAHEEELSPELLIKMADALQKKLSNLDVSKADANKVFIKKNHPASLAEILKQVTILKISETDMVFQSEYAFAPGINLHFTSPVEMFVNINPVAKPSGKLPEYYGLIHSIGETDKKELRRFVNSVFFRDHDAQVSAETEEFRKLNELKLQDKIAKELKAQEEAEAKAAEVTEKAIVPETPETDASET